MRIELEQNGVTLGDMERMTKSGIFIRKYSLDELPQLWNVLKGDMSFIGPRPLLIEYLPLYNRLQKRRHEVRPGLSGLAQVNGRNSIGWEEKFNLDIKYIDSISFAGDMKIIILTIKKIFLQESVNAGPNMTMTTFKGSPEK